MLLSSVASSFTSADDMGKSFWVPFWGPFTAARFPIILYLVLGTGEGPEH